MYITMDKSYSIRFIKFLELYIHKILKAALNISRCKNINDEFNIDSENILFFAVDNLAVSSTNDYWIFRINKNLKYKGMNLEKLINLINYGNRSVRGYHILEEVFNYVQQNIDSIYRK